ncbi:twin-arginine translocation signal domain-containing protein [Faecalibacterium prausnitzii]|uniref:Twin-arginine translocation signal domain-containing protein n=1 Tax=Faecalibacterium prausnitzii TaxID=853 RepID=A0A3E2UF43_9FIRM|nr:twin-arginine translocation signal domain-containing protein [Faecalibacterium prausnitzii]RGB94251.1 twin-arginine translocation signal domain-containing protein [Faecalibacterium prausnitzii]
MSYTFSRRAFLKYSAATAVAVAGASLLGGCEYQDPQNPVCKTLPGAITSDLQVIAGLRSMKIENGTCTLEVDIESARANPIRLTTDCFSIAVKDSEDNQRYFSLKNGGVQILDAENSRIEQKKPVTLHLAASNFPELQDGDTVLFQYIPIRENSEYSMNWEITKEVYEKFIANQSTSKN